MADGTWKVRAYIEYEIEAPNEEESILRLTECILKDLDGGVDLREIAEVNSEKIRDTGIDD